MAEINRICRCCLSERLNMKSIFDTFLADMIMSCANITINETDGLPHRICFQCVQQVTGAFTFRQQCERSDSMLQHWLINPVNANWSVSPILSKELTLLSQSLPSQPPSEASPIVAITPGTKLETNEHLITDQEVCNSSEIKIINVLIPINDKSELQLIDTVFMTHHQEINSHEIDETNSNSFTIEKEQEENQQQPNTDHLILVPVSENIQPGQPSSPICENINDINNHYQDSLEIDICNVSDNENDQLINAADFINNNEKISIIPDAYVELMNSFIVTPSNNIDMSESQNQQQESLPQQQQQQLIGVCLKNNKISDEHTTKLIQPSNLFVCLLCRKEFNNEILFIEHQKGHQRNLFIGEEQQTQKPSKTLQDKVVFRCRYCDRIFSESSYLKKHLKRHNGQRNFACTICKATFFESSVLKVHMRIHTGEKPYKCEICNKMFAQSNQLKSHSFIHEENRRYICEICDKSFNLKNQLDIHQRIHTGHRPYTCEFCDKKFTQSGNLAIHLRTHTGDKPYSCLICNKNYSTSFQVKIHSQKHSSTLQKHENTNNHRTKNIVCVQCKKMFFNKADLGVHMRMHTNERPYDCKICEKKFRMSSHLVIHMRKHTGETPFKCVVCSKEFTTGAVLKKHLLIHSGEKNYGCIHCGKTFTQPSTRNTHEKIHLKQK